VTLDGGRNWIQARMDGPSLPKSMHRFYHEFDWDGGPLLLQSRAHDSTGYVQPTKEALREIRGTNSIYHMNGIQTWYINENGEAENVEIS
jgi:sulfane dehydrogenase subunit SoxC